jgi:hypothetical protein
VSDDLDDPGTLTSLVQPKTDDDVTTNEARLPVTLASIVVESKVSLTTADVVHGNAVVELSMVDICEDFFSTLCIWISG